MVLAFVLASIVQALHSLRAVTMLPQHTATCQDMIAVKVSAVNATLS